MADAEPSGLARSWKDPVAPSGDGLAGIEIGQGQRVAGEDSDQLDGIAGLVGEGRVDLTTLDVAKYREGALAGDDHVVWAWDDLPHSACSRLLPAQRRVQSEQSTEARLRDA